MTLEDLNQDKNLCYFDSPLKVISIYDHYKYDRSDLDTLSGPQRKYLESKIQDYEPKVKSGRVIELKKINQSLNYPKPNILGGSPFDTLRYEKKSSEKVFVLSPTQAACYFLTLENIEDSKDFLKRLLKKQPVNLKKIADHARTETDFSERYNELKSFMQELQAKTVEELSARSKSHLGKVL